MDCRVLRIRKGTEARVGLEVARGPLPYVAQQLLAAEVARAARMRAHRRGSERTLVEGGELGTGRCGAPGMGPRGAVLQIPRRRLLPLDLGGQPLAGPARVRVGLVPANVDHRLVGSEWHQPAERQLVPAAVHGLAPLRRVGDAALPEPSPAFRTPQVAAVVAALVHEAEES